MLHLNRRLGESIVINNTIEITIKEIRGKNVKLSIDSPPHTNVYRKELLDKIKENNQQSLVNQDILLQILDES